MQFDSLIDDGELISAMNCPLPEEDEDGDQEMNLMSFSSAYEKMTGEQLKPVVPDSVIHDAYRAQAQQAESAAAQLLEMVDEDMPPAIDIMQPDVAPVSNGKPEPVSAVKVAEVLKQKPVTPKPKSWALMKEVNAFENSPAPERSPSLAKALFEKNDKTGVWWRTRRRFFEVDSQRTDTEPETSESLRSLITSLQNGTADVHALKRLIRICANNPCSSPPSSPLPESGMLTPLSPSPFGKADFGAEADGGGGDIWDGGRLFDQLLDSLLAYLDADKSLEILDYGLILLMEMVQRQNAFCTGHERTVFSFLLDIRYVARQNVYEATSGVRDALIERSDPVFGLTTIHRNLEDFLKKPPPDSSLVDAKTSSYCFGLVAIAKFILMLPPEVLEDQLPRIKGLLIKALGDQTSSTVREAAYVVIIASQIKLRDETQVFALIGGLSETQKHLLTYEFEKIKARGPSTAAGLGDDEDSLRGLQKLAGKMRHLDALPTNF
ncbi:suppressor of tub2 mutation [Tulasnella sp. 418]|nr:suppressor of tub2 mutation [Tulasnella sp. 418]